MLFLKYTQRTALICQLLHIQLCILLKECILRLPIVTQRPETNKCNRNLFSVITWIFEEMRYDLWSGSFPRKYGVHHLITFQVPSSPVIWQKSYLNLLFQCLPFAGPELTKAAKICLVFVGWAEEEARWAFLYVTGEHYFCLLDSSRTPKKAQKQKPIVKAPAVIQALKLRSHG